MPFDDYYRTIVYTCQGQIRVEPLEWDLLVTSRSPRASLVEWFKMARGIGSLHTLRSHELPRVALPLLVTVKKCNALAMSGRGLHSTHRERPEMEIAPPLASLCVL